MAKFVLELDLEPETIKNVEDYASNEHIKIAELVSGFLKSIGDKNVQTDPLDEAIRNMVVPDDIKAVTGILKGKVPDDVDLWEAKYQYLKEKNGL